MRGGRGSNFIFFGWAYGTHHKQATPRAISFNLGGKTFPTFSLRYVLPALFFSVDFGVRLALKTSNSGLDIQCVSDNPVLMRVSTRAMTRL